MSQKFYAELSQPFSFSNGAIGYRTGGGMDCLGPYAKVTDCPIAGTTLRRTCYASGYADTYFSVPANTKINGKHVSGFFTLEDGAIQFNANATHKHLLTDLLKGEETK